MSDKHYRESQIDAIVPAETAVMVLATDTGFQHAAADTILVVHGVPGILDVHLVEFYETHTRAVNQYSVNATRPRITPGTLPRATWALS